MPSPIISRAAENANPEAVRPPERTEAITVSRSRGGATMKPSARPGATFLERLSTTMQECGASAASGGSAPWLGWRLHGSLDQRQIYRLCYGLLVVTALKLLWNGVSGYLA